MEIHFLTKLAHNFDWKKGVIVGTKVAQSACMKKYFLKVVSVGKSVSYGVSRRSLMALTHISLTCFSKSKGMVTLRQGSKRHKSQLLKPHRARDQKRLIYSGYGFYIKRSKLESFIHGT